MKTFLSLLLIVLLCNSCKKDSTNTPDFTNLQLPAESGTIVHSSNQMAFQLFGQVLATEGNNNTLVSPLSIYMALSMVYNGADYATRDSIGKILSLQGVNPDILNQTAKGLLEQLPVEDNRVTLSIANSIWYRNVGMQPFPSFLDLTQENYQAVVSALDFSSPSALTTINDWVSEKTKGKIPQIIDRIEENDLMYLINAIYFNGSWKYSFDPSGTRDALFYRADNSTISTAFMSQKQKLLMTENENFTMVELPFGSGKAFSMFIILPKNENIPVNQFAVTLHEPDISGAIENMDTALLTLLVPKWSYSYEIKNLKAQLSAMGMGIAFTDKADFSKMYPGDVYLSKAIHKTYIKVNEEGTEAAAVTAIGITFTSSGPGVSFNLDHPFVYVIAEKQTGAILFMGTVNDPSKN